jgi:hypothetical protein
VAQAIAEAEALLGAIDLVRVEPNQVVRDVTVACVDSAHAEAAVRAVRELEGVGVDSHVLGELAHDAERVEQRRQHDDGRAVLVVWNTGMW